MERETLNCAEASDALVKALNDLAPHLPNRVIASFISLDLMPESHPSQSQPTQQDGLEALSALELAMTRWISSIRPMISAKS